VLRGLLLSTTGEFFEFPLAKHVFDLPLLHLLENLAEDVHESLQKKGAGGPGRSHHGLAVYGRDAAEESGWWLARACRRIRAKGTHQIRSLVGSVAPKANGTSPLSTPIT
jgi:hypothetical protein